MGKGGGGHFSGTRGSGSSRLISEVINGSKETTKTIGKARNLEKSGGYKKASEDFSLLNPNNTKSISTKYGEGKFGVLDDGTTISVRPGSETGGTTLEIKIPGKRLIKIRY